MSSQYLRHSLAAIARCSRRPQQARGILGSRRWISQAPAENLLESEEDWEQFQDDRAANQALLNVFSGYGSTQTRENTFQPHHTLHRPVAPHEVTLSALLAAGAHLGHSKSLMNPNFMPYAYGVRAGITVIDMDHTLPLLRRAAKVVRGVAAKDGTVVFVGTRPDLKPVVRKAAGRMGEQGFHVGEKWLPGTLTNRIAMFGASTVRDTRITPDLVVFLNPLANIHAIRECAAEHIPTIGIVDSNVDPRIVLYPIPANDESTKTAELISGILSVAGREGVALAQEEAGRREFRAKQIARMTQREATSDPDID